MTFRKNAVLYYELGIFSAVMMSLCLALIPMLGWGFALLFALPFCVPFLLNRRLNNEYITIDETGIMCTKTGIVLWAYDWDSIAALRRSNRFQLPSVEVVTYDKSGNPEPFSLPNHYFQLGRKAKQAVEQYYQDPSGL